MNRRRFLHSALGAAALPLVAKGAEAAGFEIGLVADAQYADIDPAGTRFYRKGVERLGAAVEEFNRRDLAFCLHLGDLIDRDWKSFEAITQPLVRSRHTWHQLLGNHDFSVLESERPGVPGRLGMTWRYGSFDHGAFRFAILDTNDVSTYAYPSSSAESLAARAELERLKTAGVPQAQNWNGAIGPRQLAWLEQTCTAAAGAGKKVVICAHHPVLPAGADNLWNAAEVLKIIERHRNVVAWFNGHHHAGGFAEQHGVPFVTLRGMVETADTTAFAVARLLPDRVILTGHGREVSRELRFRFVG